MPKQHSLKRTAAGLYTQFNPVHGAPEGALLEATNVVIDREGVLTKRRGFDRYGSALGAAAASALFEYQDKLIVLDGSALKYDSDGAGTWSSYSGTFAAPDSNNRIRAVESRKNLYFTSDAGIQKSDDVTTDPVDAGVPEGLDVQLSTTGTGGSWLDIGETNQGTQVAYRIIWGREDDNGLLLLSAPTQKETITNSKVASLSYTVDGSGNIEVTHNSHPYSNGDTITILDATDTDLNGTQTVASAAANTYEFVNQYVGATPGTLSAYKSYNVSVTSTIPAGNS